VDLRALVIRAGAGVLPDSRTPEVSVAPQHNKVFLDPHLMEQAFRELFTNAVEAGGTDVKVNVRVSYRSTAPTGPTDNRPSHCVVIRFCNDGPPIPVEKQEKIFERFVSAKHGHAGLGLSIVRRIIEAHGGTIKVEPQIVGTCFLMELPVLRRTA
jgi:signal transduction histidine kinase